MIVLLITAAGLILLMLTKVGIDAAYSESGASLIVRIGPLRRKLLQKPRRSAAAKNAVKKTDGDAEKRGRLRDRMRQLDLSLLFDIVKNALHALNRLRISLRIDLFRLRFIIATGDPYTTAMTYGYVQAAAGMLTPMLRRAFTVRESHVEFGTDFLASKPKIGARLILSVRIGKILRILIVTGYAFLRCRHKYRKRKNRNIELDKSSDPLEAGGTKTARKTA